MSLSTDALLFSIVLLLFGVWSSMEITESGAIVGLGLLVAVLGLLGSLASAASGSGPDADGGADAASDGTGTGPAGSDP